MDVPFYLLLLCNRNFNIKKYRSQLKNLSLYGCSHVILYSINAVYDDMENILLDNYISKVSTSLIIDFHYQIPSKLIENYFDQITYFLVLIRVEDDWNSYKKLYKENRKYGIRFVCITLCESIVRWDVDKIDELIIVDLKNKFIHLHFEKKTISNNEHYIGLYDFNKDKIEWNIFDVKDNEFRDFLE